MRFPGIYMVESENQALQAAPCPAHVQHGKWTPLEIKVTEFLNKQKELNGARVQEVPRVSQTPLEGALEYSLVDVCSVDNQSLPEKGT